MSPAIYQRFRPVAAFKALVHRRQSRDLQAELGAAIEERNEASRKLSEAMDWNVCQQENSAERIRQVEALRAANVRMLWQAIADGYRRCGCTANFVCPVCAAWRALGFEDHFDAYKAADLLPLVRP